MFSWKEEDLVTQLGYLEIRANTVPCLLQLSTDRVEDMVIIVLLDVHSISQKDFQAERSMPYLSESFLSGAMVKVEA